MTSDGRAPSPLFLAAREVLHEAARLGPIADVACGRGRHARPALACGWPVLALDRNADALAELCAAVPPGARLQAIRCDLEAGLGLPIKAGSCGAVLVFRFLFRPLAPLLVETLAPGGVLLYETFTVDQRSLEGGPRRPAFLLERGELPGLFPELDVQHYEETRVGHPPASATARLIARRPL